MSYLYLLGLSYSEEDEGLVRLYVAYVNLNYDELWDSSKTCRGRGRSLDSSTSSLGLLTLWKALLFISGHLPPLPASGGC